MGFRTHLINGIVSLVVSAVVTLYLAKEEDAPWDELDLALTAAVSGFLSGFFTSMFAKPESDAE
jgi:hypothetical protein